MKFNKEFFECSIIKLSAIITDDNVWKSELAYNWFLKEVFDFALDDMGQGFCLHSFGKVINSDDKKLLLTYY